MVDKEKVDDAKNDANDLAVNSSEEKSKDSEKEPNDGPGKPDFELIQKLPDEAKKAFLAMSSLSISPAINPVLNKVTPEHIGRILDLAENDSNRDFQSEKDQRKQNFWIFLLTIIAFIALVVFLVLVKEKEILGTIITALLGFAGGFGVGKFYNRE